MAFMDKVLSLRASLSMGAILFNKKHFGHILLLEWTI